MDKNFLGMKSGKDLIDLLEDFLCYVNKFEFILKVLGKLILLKCLKL